MKTLKGIYKQNVKEDTEIIEIRWDYVLNDSIKIIKIKINDPSADAVIEIPGELVHRFLEAFLHERKIDILKLIPSGYFK